MIDLAPACGHLPSGAMLCPFTTASLEGCILLLTGSAVVATAGTTTRGCWQCRCCLCRHYYSWVLAMLISQQNQLLHTFPRTIFSVKNFTVGGYSCMPDKIPIDRRISYPLASNLYKASHSCIRADHLACLTTPLLHARQNPHRPPHFLPSGQ